MDEGKCFLGTLCDKTAGLLFEIQWIIFVFGYTWFLDIIFVYR